MKNIARVFGIVVFVAFIGFMIAGCPKPETPEPNNPFIGTWTGYTSSMLQVKLVMTNTTWTITYNGNTYNGNYSRATDTSTLVTLKYSSGTTAGIALYTESTGRVTVGLNDSSVPTTNLYKN